MSTVACSFNRRLQRREHPRDEHETTDARLQLMVPVATPGGHAPHSDGLARATYAQPAAVSVGQIGARLPDGT